MLYFDSLLLGPHHQPFGLKGATIIADAWYRQPSISPNTSLRCFRAILHDPEIYPDPEEFKPERFLNDDGSVRDDPALSLAFGVGKRICPGRHHAEATIFIVTSSVLSVFNVGKAIDQSGNEIRIKEAVSTERRLVV